MNVPPSLVHGATCARIVAWNSHKLNLTVARLVKLKGIRTF
jgi:hypothetical protein